MLLYTGSHGSELRTRLPQFGLDVGDTVSVALETNGIGFMGFLVELPGAFVRGKTEEEALSKVHLEAKSYLEWLGIMCTVPTKGRIVQQHHCELMVEDEDGEILLDVDRDAARRGIPIPD
jgi:hypothetical protein